MLPPPNTLFLETLFALASLAARCSLGSSHAHPPLATRLRRYYYLTGDDAWLKSGGGLDLLAATADFYVSRVSTDADGLSHITCIIPPDEYAECVDDSPYTNFAAKAGLEFAVEAHTLANVEPKKEWGQVADSLVVLEAQDDTGATYHPEYAGYVVRRTRGDCAAALTPPLHVGTRSAPRSSRRTSCCSGTRWGSKWTRPCAGTTSTSTPQ